MTLGSLLLLAWLALKLSPNPQKQLSDGRTITLLATTYGQHHRYVHGKPLIKALTPFVSQQWEAAHGIREGSYHRTNATLVFWVQWHDPHGTNQTASRAVVMDEHGNESEPLWIATSFATASAGRVFAWAFKNFPRQSKTIQFALLQYPMSGKAFRLAEFRVALPSPARRAHESWPELQATQQIGNLEAALLSLVAAPLPEGRWKPVPEYVNNWNTALFSARQQGLPGQDWKVAGLAAFGENGNVLDNSAGQFLTVGDYLLYQFNGAFWPEEKNWKLRVEFSRRNAFASHECWTADLVPIPEPNRQATRRWIKEAQSGVYLESLEVSRLGMAPPSLWDAFRPGLRVSLRSTNALPDVRISLLQVQDSLGRVLQSRPFENSNELIHAFEVELKPGITNVNFVFAIHASQYFEFAAQPRRYPAQPVDLLKTMATDPF